MSNDETDVVFNHSRRNVLSYIDLDNNIIERNDDENIPSETKAQEGSAVEVKTDISSRESRLLPQLYAPQLYCACTCDHDVISQ